MLTAKEARAMTIDKDVIVNKEVNKICKSVAKLAKQGYTSFALENGFIYPKETIRKLCELGYTVTNSYSGIIISWKEEETKCE